MTDRELVQALRDKAEVEGAGSTRRLLELAARRIEDVIKTPTVGGEETSPIPIANGDGSYICDSCFETVGWDEMECYGISPVRYKFCPWCGRKVKWNA